MEDVLIALYRAPHGRSFHGLLHQRTDLDVRQRALSARATVSMVSVASAAPDGELGWDVEVWVDGDRRSRVDRGGWIRLEDGDQVVTYTPGNGAVTSVELPAQRWVSMPSMLWRPRPLIGAIEIASVNDGLILDRPCWQVAATRDLARDPMMQMLLPGDRFEFCVDQETGVVLRCLEWSKGEELSSTEWLEFQLLDRVDVAVFERALPPGVPVRSQTEVMLERAEALGVDLSDVDTGDAQQIAAAMHVRRRPGLLDHHLATAAPPTDVAAAEDEIRAAFAGLGVELGDALPNVEAGEGLAPTRRRAAERFAPDGAEIAVSQIKFRSDVRAAVVFAISVDNAGPLLGSIVGEAVFSEGRWRVARSTFAQLMRMAGVEPPAPR